MAYDYFRAENKDFDLVYDIMRVSFPESELRDYDEMRALFDNSNHFNIYCLGHHQNICAAIVVWQFDDFIFIENFASANEYRGKGLGGALLDIVLKRQQKLAILEVEPPIDLIQQRRIKFYQRHGLLLNDFDYLMPPLHDGDKPLPLKIMSYPALIPQERFAPFKAEIYKTVYNNRLPV